MPADENPDQRGSPDRSGTSWSRVLFTCTALLAILVAVVGVARYVPITRHYFTDADTIRVPVAESRTRDILWQPAHDLSDLVNTTVDDYEPRLSADGLTLYFVRGRAGENAEILVSAKTPDGWSEPRPLVGINSEHDDLGPEPTVDGRSLYFYSDRPGGAGGYDLWVSHQGLDGWQPPINLGPAVNSEFNDYGPAVTPDGRTLYFASNRPPPASAPRAGDGAWPATLREDRRHRAYDLYSAPVSDRGFGTAVPLTALNTPYYEGAPAVSSFGDFLYFASDRPGGEGAFDLYRSRRLRGQHEPPINLGKAVNTPANELDPGLSLGGYALYFSSDRPRADAAVSAGETPEYNLYYTTSREVFSETERLERPPINWAALWARVGPNLLWALLALLLLLLLLALLRDMQQRRMGLLAKCLMTSVMAHLLLMLLLNTWEVTSALASEFRRRGPIQVALASNEVGNDLASQLRGRLTSVQAPEPATTQLERQQVPFDQRKRADAASLAVEARRDHAEDTSTVEATLEDARIYEQIVRADLSETRVELQPPPALDAELPENVPPPTQAEPDSSRLFERLASEQPVTSRHTSSHTTAEWEPATASQLVPERTAAHSGLLDSTSMATLSDARDAPAVSSVASVDQRSTNAYASVPPADLTLPTADVERPPETAEVQPTITLPAAAAPRRRFSDNAAVQADSADVTHLPPLTTSAPTTDASSVEALTGALSDATPTGAGLPPSQRQAAAPTAPPLDRIDLAVPDGPVAEAPVESMLLQEPQLTRHERAAAFLAPHHAQSDARDVAFAPVADSDSREESSLIDAVTAVDRAIPHIGDPRPAPSVATPSAVPQLPQIALPSMEQHAFASQRESDINAATPDVLTPRAAFDPAQTIDGALGLDRLAPARFEVAETQPMNPVVDGPAADSPTVRPDATLLALNVPRTDDFLPTDALDLALDVPTEMAPPENPYLQRQAENRLALVERLGGSRKTERAVADALRWLARHQSPDGRWDGAEFDQPCRDCGGETGVQADHALTGLSLLAFLGSGHTHVTDGPYRSNVQRAIQWLARRQRPDGDLRGEETMYSHAIAAIALSEAFGMTRDPELAEPVRNAMLFIDAARNTSGEGGWRYDPGQPGDTSVLGWQVMALKSATLNGLPVPAESFAAAREWMDRVDLGPRPGLYRYRPERGVSPSMTAEGMFVQQLLGLSRDDDRMSNGADYIGHYLPEWDAANTYFWYYATLALFQHQGDSWRTWNERLTRELLENQRRSGAPAGSWDPVGEWADKGGRVYQTALCALMLEVYYRYLPLYSLELPEDAIGTLVGTVRDARSSAPLSGATVHVDLPGRPAVASQTDAAGRYELLVPEVPAFFAITASRPGYDPDSRNVDAAMLKGRTLEVDFELTRQSRDVVSVEAVPEVHHLGDNRFEGAINSQFQKESEGDRYTATFEITSVQRPPRGSQVEIRLLAKGVQRSHRIVINGTDLDKRLDSAPDDGSFGEFTARFDASLLQVGTNVIEIIAKPSTTDIDDFEFVNVRFYLSP